MIVLSGGANAIYLFDLDTSTGAATPHGAPVSTGNGTSPTFAVVDVAARDLYVSYEASSEVAAFAIGADASLTPLGRVPSGGSGPAFISLDQSRSHVLVAHYNGGSVSVLARNSDGSLGKLVSSHTYASGALTHAVIASPDDRFLVSPNLGLDDLGVLAYDDKTGLLTGGSSVTLKTGTGPRHIAFHPSGKFAFVSNEIGNSVTSLAYDALAGAFTVLQTVSTLPDGGPSGAVAEIAVAPSGKFVYVSNRGDDSIVTLGSDDQAKLTPLAWNKTGGKTPRHFSLDASGRLMTVGNQATNSVRVFSVEPNTGGLTALGGLTTVPSPAFVAAYAL